jgi:hypothetical protein
LSFNDLVPAYYDGADRSKPPAFFKTHQEIKQQRKDGLLHGWYADHSKIFVIYRPFSAKPVVDREKAIAAGCMADAWVQAQSGYAGPMVLQMPTRETRP